MSWRGTTILGWALAITLAVGVAVGYLLWHNWQSEADANQELKSELATLRRGGPTSTADGLSVQGASTTASPGATSDGASDGARTMQLKDFGIRFQVPPSLADLTYAENPPASGVLQLTTGALQSKGTNCGGAGILGALLRYPKGQALPANTATAHAQTLATAGSYDYYYLPLAQNPCTDQATLGTISTRTAEVKTALKTITAE